MAIRTLTDKEISEFSISDILKIWTSDDVKAKLQKYHLAHYHMNSGITEKKVWELLRKNEDLSFLECASDDFQKWFLSVKAELESEFQDIEDKSRELADKASTFSPGKDTSNYLHSQDEVQGIVKQVAGFMLSQKDYSQFLWDHLRPKAVKPFQGSKEV